MIPGCGDLPLSLCLRYSFHDYSTVWMLAICSLIAAGYWYFRIHGKKKAHLEPFTYLDEMDKAGNIRPYEISDEQEGAAFLQFERASGDIDNRGIGQPFTFDLADDTIERHHLNPRGSYECVDPAQLFDAYVPDPKRLNRVAGLTQQHIRMLRTGEYSFHGKNKHMRTFMLIAALSLLIGLGLGAASTAGHP